MFWLHQYASFKFIYQNYFNNLYIIKSKFNPLKAYLYREGFARLSGTRFSLDSIADTCKQIDLLT